MIKHDELHSIIKGLCDEYSLSLEVSEKDVFRVYTDYFSGITIFFKFEEQSTLSFYFLQRTPDVVYQGDRSDVHVVLSLMFSSFLRLFDLGISCSLFDIPHPVVPDEIWGRYIMPEQAPILFGLNSKERLVEIITKIISMTSIWRGIIWENLECPCEKCLKEAKIDNDREYEIPPEIHEIVQLLYTSDHVNYGSRIRPNWGYYYDMDNELTIIKSKNLSNYLRFIFQFKIEETKKVEGINGKLLLDGEINNLISNNAIEEFNSIIKSLIKKKTKITYNVIPLENMLITVVQDYIIALGRQAGKFAYKQERELVRKRHNIESQLLFPISEFEWLNPVCPDQFENLIKALLEREPNVKTVRKPAPMNQGDKGRDLLIEWSVINRTISSNDTPAMSLVKFVGQCKTSNKTIGKNKVLDIRDTLETHNSRGYFLAVNTQISASLTEKLEELKNKGFVVEWWNKEDIENRLSNNQDLIPLFQKVVISKRSVKYINPEE